MQQTDQHCRNRHVSGALLLGLCVIAFAPGCASVTNLVDSYRIPVAGPNNPVIDFACIWQQGKGHDKRGMPCRGFCGQMLFTTVHSKSSAIADGAVTIFVFDNAGPPGEQVKPLDVFEFTAEQWNTFRYKTTLGMAYQLFVPYSRPGSQTVDCTLHVRYTPRAGGTPIMSHPSSITLEGPTSAGIAAAEYDRKLAEKSPLFANSPLMKNGSSDQSMHDLVRKMQRDSILKSAAEATTPAVPTSRPSVPADPQPKPEIERLQAILDQSTARQVEQAEYVAPSSGRRRVEQAAYETESR